MTQPKKRTTFFTLLAVFAALVVAAPASAQPAAAAKRAEADRVLAEIQAIDAELSLVVDAYNAAQTRLEQIRADQAENARHLAIAKGNLKRSQQALQERLVALYESSDASVVEILLGASSLSDLLARAETVDRVSEQDTRIIREVRAFTDEVKRRERALAAARAEQEDLVAARAARKAEIEAQIAERQRLLSSIRSEIAELEAAERERQERLAAEARDRISSSAPAESSGDGGDDDFAAPIGSPPPSQYGGVVGIAMRYLGIPYQWGGASPSGFDCSGLVYWSYGQLGIKLPHSSYALYDLGRPVERSQMKVGDLVFFSGIGHMGIYIGRGRMVHAPHSGARVEVVRLEGSYFGRLAGVRRIA
jgi:cell wall-associated NlpC family hydrolase